MKIDFIFLIVLGIVIGYVFMLHKVESMVDVSITDQVKEAVRQVYLADVEAIRNLSNVATQLQANGLTVPGNLVTKGSLTVNSNIVANSGDFHIPIIAQSNTDAHIQLKTKNDDNKNIYLINRDGNFRVHYHGIGDKFEVNRNGNAVISGNITVNSGDFHIPIIAQSNADSHIQLKTKNDDNKNVYLINRDGNFKVHHHGIGDKFEVNRDGNIVVTGNLIVNGRNILAELDKCVKKEQPFRLDQLNTWGGGAGNGPVKITDDFNLRGHRGSGANYTMPEWKNFLILQ